MVRPTWQNIPSDVVGSEGGGVSSGKHEELVRQTQVEQVVKEDKKEALWDRAR